MSRACHAFLSVNRSLVVTCWELTNLLALLCVMFCCGVVGKVWYLIVSIPDHCLLTYFRQKELESPPVKMEQTIHMPTK